MYLKSITKERTRTKVKYDESTIRNKIVTWCSHWEFYVCCIRYTKYYFYLSNGVVAIWEQDAASIRYCADSRISNNRDRRTVRFCVVKISSIVLNAALQRHGGDVERFHVWNISTICMYEMTVGVERIFRPLEPVACDECGGIHEVYEAFQRTVRTTA